MSFGNIVKGNSERLTLGQIALGILSVALFVIVMGEYVLTQKRIMDRLPPDHYAFLPLLGKAPFRHASFVVDNYAGPVTAYTDQWAYYDPLFPMGEINLDSNGFEVSRDVRHLWTRDQLENPAYNKPDYYLCMKSQNPVNQIIVLNNKGLAFGCGMEPIAVRAAGGQDVLQHQIIARDEIKDSWMIIKLDWEFPPFLVKESGSDRWLRSTANYSGIDRGQATIQVDDEYAQQDGLPEEGTILRVYGVDTDSTCQSGSSHGRKLLASAIGKRQITLPSHFSGSIAISVTPATAKRAGFEYFSEIIRIPGIKGEKIQACAYVPTPVNFLNAFAMQYGREIKAYWSPVEYATDYLVELRENEGNWLRASYIKGHNSEVDLEVFDPQAHYSLRIKPCNGAVCGSYSKIINVVRSPIELATLFPNIFSILRIP